MKYQRITGTADILNVVERIQGSYLFYLRARLQHEPSLSALLAAVRAALSRIDLSTEISTVQIGNISRPSAVTTIQLASCIYNRSIFINNTVVMGWGGNLERARGIVFYDTHLR